MFDEAQRHHFQGFDLVILHDARSHRSELESLESALLELATYARGWDAKMLPRMRAVFKLEPFYYATSLVLAFRDDMLLGTAGIDTDFDEDDGRGHIIHLCSVNLRASLRNGGLMALLLVLLADHVLAKIPAHDDVYFTSISQSPLVYSVISKIAPLHPDGRTRPPADIVKVAQTVAAKYDGHLALETDTLVLRNECDFFYRDLPRVANRKINDLFERMLDIPQGDVFVNVGKCSAAEAISRISRYRKRFLNMPGGPDET